MGFLRDFFDGASEEPLNCCYGADSFLSFRRTLDRDWCTTEKSQVYAWTLSLPRGMEETFRPLTLPPAIRLSDVSTPSVVWEDADSERMIEDTDFVGNIEFAKKGGVVKDTGYTKEADRRRVKRMGCEKNTDIGPLRAQNEVCAEDRKNCAEDRKNSVGKTWADRRADRETGLHEGYRHRMYRDPQQHLEIPMVVAAVSAQRLLATFLALSDVLDTTVDLVLETSRGVQKLGDRRDYLREQMDLPVLQSLLWENESMLMNDGRMGLAILDPDRPLELQMDEHKLIYIYTHEPEPFERCLREMGIFEDERLEVVTQRAHCHGSSPEYARQLERLIRRVSAEEMS